MIKDPYGNPTMSVKELIEELSRFDPDLPVKTEGCDCYGTAVMVVELSGEVIINRG